MTFPYTESAQIRKRDGTLLARVPARSWRTGDGTPAISGQQYDWEAWITEPTEYGESVSDEPPFGFLERKGNLVYQQDDGEELRIVDAIAYPTLGYMVLALREVQAGG